jgi:CRISPR-associated protein Csb2
LLGLALAIPRDAPSIELARCLNPLLFEDGLPRRFSLPIARLGNCELEADDRSDSRFALQPETWTAIDRPSRRWSTVTPIALDRHAKSDTPATEIEATIAASCERIGLPRPADVILSPVSLFVGAPTAGEMPRLERKADGGRIRHTHAILTFAEPVVGPVLIGAGRYRGYGLCRPIPEEVEP